MNGYNFTERVRKVLAMAREEAAHLHADFVAPEHIFLALLREGQGVGAAMLTNLGLRPDSARQLLLETLPPGRPGQPEQPDLAYTARAKRVLELAMAEARDLDHSYVGTEHLLLGILREERSPAARLLAERGITLESARAEGMRLVSVRPAAQSSPLGPFARVLTPKAIRRVRVELELDDGSTARAEFASLLDALHFLHARDAASRRHP